MAESGSKASTVNAPAPPSTVAPWVNGSSRIVTGPGALGGLGQAGELGAHDQRAADLVPQGGLADDDLDRQRLLDEQSMLAHGGRGRAGGLAFDRDKRVSGGDRGRVGGDLQQLRDLR